MNDFSFSLSDQGTQPASPVGGVAPATSSTPSWMPQSVPTAQNSQPAQPSQTSQSSQPTQPWQSTPPAASVSTSPTQAVPPARPWDLPKAPPSSYADEYLPPTVSESPKVAASWDMPARPTPVVPPTQSVSPTSFAAPAPAMATTALPSMPKPAWQPTPAATTPAATPTPVTPMPVTPPPAVPAPVSTSAPKTDTETLEDQNIFHLLGVEAATDEEKESFLDELQEVIWEDFRTNDVDLLLTEQELVDFKKIDAKTELSEEARQSEMIDFLEKLIPDLEAIMLEKALELKEEMIRERITQLTEQYKEMPEKLAQVKEALRQADAQQWRSAANTLNRIAP